MYDTGLDVGILIVRQMLYHRDMTGSNLAQLQVILKSKDTAHTFKHEDIWVKQVLPTFKVLVFAKEGCRATVKFYL